jgi:C1A family cysteine protease
MAKTKRPRKPQPRRTSSAVSVASRVCNLVESRKTETDWKYEDALTAGALGAPVALPASVDLRATWWAIGDQENTGSCVGWATAEGVVRYHMVKIGKLAKTEQLSPRFVWMGSKETDEFVQRPETFIEGAGTSLKAAVEICRKYGIVTMPTLPFHIATKMYTGNGNVFFQLAAQRRIVSYFNLAKNLNQWKSWLASNGPILVGLQVDQTWDQATSTNGNLDTFVPGTVRGGHAVSVVGYTAAGRFILRNSWGTGWGDKGFGYASQAYIAAAFFNESYGVTV